jgi:hypothetical protein
MAAQLLLLGQIYLGLGALTAIPFLTIGLGRIDENAQDAWIFRAMMIPGVLMIWPLVLYRWWVLEKGTYDEANRHTPPFPSQTRLFLILACALPVVIFAALVIRQEGPLERPAQMIEAPK